MDGVPLRIHVKQVLEQAWTEPGFCVPNPTTYPHQWLWDSCFHTIIWAELQDDRAVIELATALANQHLESGFVPHMTYWSDPSAASTFWGRPLTSSITQPPMYGHAAAELTRRGFEVPEVVVDRIEKAFVYLLVGRERTPSGLVPVFHPWETGCDDSPRWDGQPHSGPVDLRRWREQKGRLVRRLRYGGDGVAPLASSDFQVGSVGFNALVAFNLEEFATIRGVAERPVTRSLLSGIAELRRAISGRWDDGAGTWVDDGGGTSASVRTADAMLGLLVDYRDVAAGQLMDPTQFGARFGPTGVHRAEPSFDPNAYWRGPSWPQLNYLLVVAARRAGDDEVADNLAFALERAAVTSGLAEYWNPDTGDGHGAAPQTWTGLGLVSPG